MPSLLTGQQTATSVRSLGFLHVLLLVATSAVGAPAPTEEPAVLKGHESPLRSVAFSPDGKTLATGDSHGEIKLWDVATKKELVSIDGYDADVWSLAFSPDGKTLASGGGCLQVRDKGIKLWDIASGKELPGPPRQKGTVGCVAFAPDGKTLAFADGASYLRFWDVEGKKIRLSIEAPGFATLAYSPDGKALAAGSGGGHVKVWDPVSGKELHNFQARSTRVHQLCYMPDGKGIVLVNFNGNSIQVWEPGKERNEIVVRAMGDTDRTPAFALAPDGKTAATLTIKGVLQVRDAKTWKMRAAVPADERGYVHAIGFSPDGKLLATGGNDKTVKLWSWAKLLKKKLEK